MANINWSTVGDIGKLFGGLGSFYAGLKGYKLSKQMLDLQRRSLEEERQRRKRSQARIDLAANRAFSPSYDTSVRLPIS